jgi:glycerol-3-phosphate dehydrogenase subunit C
MSVIARAPSSPPARGPHDERYFDARDLEAELKRTFQICHECRMCVGYCGSFPELFKRIDRDIESGRAEGAEALDYQDFVAVGEECWQCKLCYIKCPYTEDEGASELLDYPRLMGREKTVRARRDGIPLVDRILGEPQLIGRMSSGVAAPAAQLVQANRLLRKVQEKVTGISAEFPLPPPAQQTFGEWFRAHTPASKAGDAGEVVLFATCTGDYNTPHIPQAAVRVLEHNGLRVFVPGYADEREEQPVTCCGMPTLDGGDVSGFAAKARHNVAVLLPHVRAGRKVVMLQPTCGLTAKREWFEHLGTPEAREVSAAVVDMMELLVLLGREKKLVREFEKSLGTVAYHAPCHLRAQKIGFPGARVLGVVPDTDVRVVEQCSAVDGTWGMKAKHYETGRKYARKLVRGIAELEADMVVSDCTLSSLRISHENGVRVYHPVEALAQAYGLGAAQGLEAPARVAEPVDK